MERSLSEMIESLRRLDLKLRSQIDAAETWVPQIDQVVDNLVSIGLLQEMVVLGSVVHTSSYNPQFGPEDSGQIIQAAFGIGLGGFGALRWDSEEYLAFTKDSFDQELLQRKIVPFLSLDDATRGLLLPQLRPLIGTITRLAGV